MKKCLAGILAVMMILSLCVSAFAAEDAQSETYTIMVNGQMLNLDGLPLAPYREGGTVMVPLRRIGEALGYKVGWDAETRAITIDDEYIQKATLFNGSAAAVFEGRLQVINMSREIENTVPTAVHNGCTYVPLEFFQEFFNDTGVEGTTVTIAPSMCELDAAVDF